LARASRRGTPAFQKGQSGNLQGRRKGSKNVATLLEQALHERVVITENGKRKTITKLEAMLKQLANKAASGDHHAIKLLIPLAETYLASSRPAAGDAPASAPLPSPMERRARALETVRILKEIGYFDREIGTAPQAQAGRTGTQAKTEADP
jgi:hypothetical protein